MTGISTAKEFPAFKRQGSPENNGRTSVLLLRARLGLQLPSLRHAIPTPHPKSAFLTPLM